MALKPSLYLPAVLLLVSACGVAQEFKIPVTCSRAHDVADPPHPPAPHDAKPSITEAEALQIDKAGRKEPGFISMPEPENFGIIRYRIGEYASCADRNHCYWNDLQQQLDRAIAELKRLVASHKGENNLAIVLDIDETSLSNYCELKREGFGYIATQYNQFLVSPDASIAIPGTLKLFNEAIADKVSVFFITGRPHDQTEATARDLHLAGYTNWAGLVLRNEDELTMDTTWYKSTERAKIAKDYRIILSVGDQWSDLNGSPAAEVSVKLPNPFYFLP
jgi:hypothetical protein